MAVFRFDWDEDKNQINRAKHGIDFLDATNAFKDPFRTERLSLREGSTEIRRVVVGTVDEEIMAVICTERKPFIRVISARKARRNERREYHDRRAASGWESL